MQQREISRSPMLRVCKETQRKEEEEGGKEREIRQLQSRHCNKWRLYTLSFGLLLLFRSVLYHALIQTSQANPAEPPFSAPVTKDE